MKLSKNFSLAAWMQGDMVIWMIIICMFMISVVEVYSTSSTLSFGGKSSYWEPVLQHCLFWVIGLLAVVIVSRMPCNYFKLGGTLFLFLALGLQFVALFSGKVNGASRWIPVFGFSFQPSELTKVTLVTYVAFIYATLRDAKGVSPVGVKFAAAGIIPALGLIVTENLSTAALIFLIMLGMAFYAQVRARLLAIIVALVVAMGAAALIAAYEMPDSVMQACNESEYKVLHRVPTWVHRITDSRDLPQDPKDYVITDNNVQKTHAYIAVATSHVIGKGPGKSRQRDYLPQAYSDFIYAIIIEEMGIVGAVVVMSLYLLLMWRCKKIAGRCKSLFPSYLVMGLSLMMVLQALVNMAVAVGAMPVTGQTLPLISRGGTSILINCVCMGMILSVSRTAKMTQERTGDTPQAPGSAPDAAVSQAQ